MLFWVKNFSIFLNFNEYLLDENKEISQVGASKVVQARVEEILKLAKISIKNLRIGLC